MKKFSRQDQRLLATWGAECAKRVLPLFERTYPEDERPRKAIQMLRKWIRTGVFKMADIRGASLAAHAAAKVVKEDAPASLAAHAAGQAVATAHVPQHAYGSSYYALKAIAAAYPETAETRVTKERTWQARRLPEHLREEFLRRMIVEKHKSGVRIKLDKGPAF